MTRSLFIGPHPDDEVLGCGGTILRKISQEEVVGWVIVTDMRAIINDQARVRARESEIEKVRRSFGLEKKHLYELGFPATQLDRVPLASVVERISQVVYEFVPEEIYYPHMFDAHSDHRVVAQAAMACSKWFRHPSVKRVFTYETPSETDAAIGGANPFVPNYFVDITGFLESKMRIADMYEGEMGIHPFPRSRGTLQALAQYRGSQCGFKEAEAFMLQVHRS